MFCGGVKYGLSCVLLKNSMFRRRDSHEMGLNGFFLLLLGHNLSLVI